MQKSWQVFWQVTEWETYLGGIFFTSGICSTRLFCGLHAIGDLSSCFEIATGTSIDTYGENSCIAWSSTGWSSNNKYGGSQSCYWVGYSYLVTIVRNLLYFLECIIVFTLVFPSHHIWLRDHCRCPKCFHSVTKQRLVNTFEVGCCDNFPKPHRVYKLSRFPPISSLFT